MSTGQVVQNTSRSFSVTLTGDGSLDLTTATGAHLRVHRAPTNAPETIETWTATIRGGATANSSVIDVPLLGSSPGVQAVTIIGESLRLRPYLSFSAAPDVEFSQQLLSVVEA